MADVLAEIVAAKRIEVEARFGAATADAMRAEVTPTTRSLRAVLSRPGARFVMEVKRASPSGHRSNVEPSDAARAYAGIADAVSVLTDAPYFHGSLDDLRTVRAIFDGPILAKDFVVDPRQLIEARAAGADAALCMLSVLGNAEAAAVYAEAARLGMDVITEVHNETELARAAALGADIIGINNRDLKTLTTDLAVTERLAPLAPREALLISESGIATRADVQRLARHVDAFLVGSSLMAAPDVGEAARALVYCRTKICGITNVEDASLVLSAGATHVGMIFVSGTPRAIDVKQAGPIAAVIHAGGAKPVGVFRDATTRDVIDIARTLDLAVVQLHGREDAATIATIRAGFDGEIWAVSSGGEGPRLGVNRTLFDTGSGGTGEIFDWSTLANRPDLATAFLAGGLTPENAAAASRVGAYGLDVSSGVEAAPGRKDPEKMTAFFAALRPPARNH